MINNNIIYILYNKRDNTIFGNRLDICLNKHFKSTIPLFIGICTIYKMYCTLLNPIKTYNLKKNIDFLLIEELVDNSSSCDLLPPVSGICFKRSEKYIINDYFDPFHRLLKHKVIGNGILNNIPEVDQFLTNSSLYCKVDN